MTVTATTPFVPYDNSPLGAVMALAVQGTLSIGDLFSAAAVLQDSGQTPAAIALYRAWIAHTPSPLIYAACFNLAVLLSNLGDDAGAEPVYRHALEHNTNFIEARLNLGTLFERTGRPDEALALWGTLLTDEVQPDIRTNPPMHVQTLNNLGRLLEIRKRYPEAEAMLADSLRVNPNQPNVMTHWVHLRQKQCEWPVYSGLDHISVASMMEGTSALAMLSASDDPAEQLAAARRFVRDKVDANVAPLSGQHGYGHARLRIGYLSSDFCSHAVSILTAELYELHDRSKFEIYAFSWSREDGSPLRARVVNAMDHYIRIDGIGDEQAARVIRGHEIDILIDLHGLTLGARPNILAFRPAPVQLTYLGFPGSTGLPGIDYVLADAFLITPEMAEHFSEKPLYLPDTFQINDRQRQIAPRPTRASVGLPDEAFVFCSFNNNFKFTPEVFAAWMNILRRVPGSVLWLVADYPEVRENLGRHAEQAGVARERLIFNTRAMPADYLARYQLADLFLDTYPFNAGTTASDALWAGLPLLTCAGRTFSSRMAGSLLRAVDLPELITYNFADYEELAVTLAGEPRRIAAMKQKLADNRATCALFDSPRFVRNMEAALLSVAKTGTAPAGASPAWVDEERRARQRDALRQLPPPPSASAFAPAPAPAYPQAAAPTRAKAPAPAPVRAASPAAPAASTVNHDLLALVPANAHRVVELGCRDGAFAAALRQRHPRIHYTGIGPELPAQLASRFDAVHQVDIETAGPQLWAQLSGADCWILDEALEQMNDPWALLATIRAQLAPGGHVVAALRNIQHWSMQARLNAGDLRYGPGAALEKHHKRAFTRGAMLDMFAQAGLRITGGSARIPDEPAREKYLPAIRLMAQASGIDPALAVDDALPTQYILTATAS